MNNWLKISLLSISVLIIGIGLMAFRPIGDPQNGDETSDHKTALADALGISVEELKNAFQAVNTKMIEQAVEDGYLSQDQADIILEGETPPDGRHMRFPDGFMRGDNFNDLLAEELGIDLETLLAAQEKAQETLLDQALEDGKISQEEYEMMQVRTKMNPYFSEAFSEAYQNAVDAALADGVITDAQAEALLENSQSFGPGFRMPGFGHGPEGHMPFHNPLESKGQ